MRLLVVGSAFLDIRANAQDPGSGASPPPSVSIEVGGSAVAIASGLVSCGAQVRVLTALPDSPYAAVIEQFVQGMGVEVMVEILPSMAIPARSTHYDPSGEMLASVFASPLEDHDFSAEMIDQAIGGVSGVMLDCGLSSDMLSTLAWMARERGLPVFLVAMEPAQLPRVLPYARHVDTVFTTHRAVMEHQEQRGWGSLDLELLPREHGGQWVVVADGYGTFVITEQESTEVSPVGIEAGAGYASMQPGPSLVAAVAFMRTRYPQMELTMAATEAMMLPIDDIGLNRQHAHRDQTVGRIISVMVDDAMRDTLTGLFNRRYAETSLGQMWQMSSAQGSSIILIDLDRFKALNDAHGHNAGDEVLRNVGQTLQHCLRGDDIAARWGGEEFICLLPNTPIADALRVAERLREALARGVRRPDGHGQTASLGVATLDGGDWRIAVSRADQALYEAKESGRNRVCAYPGASTGLEVV